MEAASTRWPQLRTSLEKSASVLRITQSRLKRALSHRDEAAEALKQSVELSAVFAKNLPALLEQLERGLEHQENSLGELSGSIEKVTEAVPEAAQSVSRLLAMARLLLTLFGLIAGVHGGFLVIGHWRAAPAST